jgi:PAS domain S-box-containing protein
MTKKARSRKAGARQKPPKPSNRNRERAGPPPADPDVPRLLQDLQIRQMELESRNESLLEACSAMEASTRRYADLFNLAPVGYLTLDANGDIVDANLTASGYLGLDQNQLIGRRFGAMLALDSRPALNSMLGAATANVIGRCEVALEQEYATIRHARLQCVRAGGPTQQGLYLIAMLDISEQMRLEQNLRDSEARFREVFETANAGMVIAGPDSEFREVNDEFCRILGYSRDELLQRRAFDIIHPDEIADNRYLAERARRGESREFNFIRRCIRKDGSVVHLNVSSRPKYDSLGRMTHSVAVVVDITGQRHAELELRQREEMLRMFIEHTPAAVAILDRDIRYLAVSRRFLADYGLAAANVIGRSHYELFPGIPDRWREVHRRCLAGASERCDEDSFVRPDGSTEWLRWEIVPWRSGAGSVGGIILFSEVITERRRLEHKLRDSERHYREIFESANVGIARTDCRDRFVDANETFCAMLGYDRKEILTMHSTDLVFPEDRDESSRLVAQALAGRLPTLRIARRYRRRDGSEVWVDLHARSMGGPGDGECGTLGIIVDITEHRRAEAALRRSEERFRTVFRNTPDAIVLATLDGRILEANWSFESLTGYRLEDVTGRLPSELGLWTDLATRERYISALKAHGRVHGFEAEFRTRAGELRTGEIAGELVDIGGQRLTVNIVRDITERKRFFAALRESESQYREIFSAANVGIARADPDDRILIVNDKLCEMLGYTREELLSKHTFDLVHPDDVAESQRLTALARAGALHLHRAERRWLRKDGTVIWVDVSVRNVLDDSGREKYSVGFVYDITERKENEQRLRAQMERVELLSRRLVEIEELQRRRIARELHDNVGQTLTALKINLHLLKRELETTADGKGRARIEAATAITDAAIQRVQGVMLELRPPLLASLGLPATVRSFAEDLSRLTGIAVNVAAPQDRWLDLDEDFATALFRVAQEALNNVVKHARATKVDVTLARDGNRVTLTVSDNGSGFDPAAAGDGRPHWGMTTMRERVEAFGGELRVESAPASGTMLRATAVAP